MTGASSYEDKAETAKWEAEKRGDSRRSVSDTPWTPGPWEVDHHEDTWFVPTIAGQATEANARLIAAAPEMAELLAEAQRHEGVGWVRGSGSGKGKNYDWSLHARISALLFRIRGEA